MDPYLKKQLCQPDNNTTKAEKNKKYGVYIHVSVRMATDLQYTCIYIHFLRTELNKRIKLLMHALFITSCFQVLTRVQTLVQTPVQTNTCTCTRNINISTYVFVIVGYNSFMVLFFF